MYKYKSRLNVEQHLVDLPGSVGKAEEMERYVAGWKVEKSAIRTRQETQYKPDADI